MAEYRAYYNVLHTDCRVREKISDLDDTHPGILRAKLVHLRSSIVCQDKWDIWIQSYKTQSQHTNYQTKIRGHEDGIVSGDTMNFYIPLYTPKSDMTAFIKPYIMVFSHWYDRVQYSTMHCTSNSVH